MYHTMRYLFGIYKKLIKHGLQRNSDTIVLYRNIYGISSDLAFFDRSTFCPFLIWYIFVLSVISVIRTWQCPLVHRCLYVTCSVVMHYSCVLCAPHTFRDDLHRHRDDFLHRINIFFALFLSVRRPLALSGDM